MLGIGFPSAWHWGSQSRADAPSREPGTGRREPSAGDSQCWALGLPRSRGCPELGAEGREAKPGNQGFPMLGIGFPNAGHWDSQDRAVAPKRGPRAARREPRGESRKPGIPNAGHWDSHCRAVALIGFWGGHRQRPRDAHRWTCARRWRHCTGASRNRRNPRRGDRRREGGEGFQIKREGRGV